MQGRKCNLQPFFLDHSPHQSEKEIDDNPVYTEMPVRNCASKSAYDQAVCTKSGTRMYLSSKTKSYTDLQSGCTESCALIATTSTLENIISSKAEDRAIKSRMLRPLDPFLISEPPEEIQETQYSIGPAKQYVWKSSLSTVFHRDVESLC